jgi:hypothetical protein
MGTYTSTFAGGYIDAKLALAAESFVGGKAETHQGPLLQGGKLKNEKMNVSINNYSQTLITKTNINVINAKITMVG